MKRGLSSSAEEDDNPEEEFLQVLDTQGEKRNRHDTLAHVPMFKAIVLEPKLVLVWCAPRDASSLHRFLSQHQGLRVDSVKKTVKDQDGNVAFLCHPPSPDVKWPPEVTKVEPTGLLKPSVPPKPRANDSFSFCELCAGIGGFVAFLSLFLCLH